MMPNGEMVADAQLHQVRLNLIHVRRVVVDADRQSRMVPFDDVHGAAQGREFHAFDVRFQEADALIGEVVIKRMDGNGFHCVAGG